MPKRSKLLQALDDHRGRDYDAEKQKKLVKAAEKRKAAKKAAAGEDGAQAKDKVGFLLHPSSCPFALYMVLDWQLVLTGFAIKG